jgi:putative chitinase
MLTRTLLQRLCPRPANGAKARIWDGYVEALVSEEGADLFMKYGVTTPKRMTMFLSQICHEPQGFTILYESGAYSAKRIMEIFGVGRHSAAVTAAEARSLAGNGYALFERVYGLGNPKKARELGNTQKGDGWRFRGVGFGQTTGRGAHEKYSARIGCSLDGLAAPINSLHAILLEWNEKGCNKWADADDIVTVTKRINGGQNGIADRRQYLAKAKKLLARADLDAPFKIPAADGEKPGSVSLGDEGRGVRRLQELLVRAGYVTPVDGAMGPRTEGQVAAFQINRGLPATGIADEATWEALETAEPPLPRDVTVTDLAKKGSRTVWLTQWGKRLLKWLGFGSIGAAVDGAATGGATLNGAIEGLEAGRQTVSQVTSFLGWGLTWPGILIAVAVLLGLGLYWLLEYIEQRRVTDAQVGANLKI